MSTQKYHHIAANTWQSNHKEANESTYGLTHIDIYKPNSEEHMLLHPKALILLSMVIQTWFLNRFFIIMYK